MTAIAVNDSRVAHGDPPEPKEKPEWQNQSEANTLCSRHLTLSQIPNRHCRINSFSRGQRNRVYARLTPAAHSGDTSSEARRSVCLFHRTSAHKSAQYHRNGTALPERGSQQAEMQHHYGAP